MNRCAEHDPSSEQGPSVVEFVLRPSRITHLGYFLFFLAMSSASVLMLREGRIVGALAFAYGLLGMVACLAALFSPKLALRLSRDGVRFGTLRKSYFYRWADISVLGVGRVAGQRRVCFNFRQDYPEEKKLRAINQASIGFDRFLPNAYGKKPMELAALLGEWRQRYAHTSSSQN